MTSADEGNGDLTIVCRGLVSQVLLGSRRTVDTQRQWSTVHVEGLRAGNDDGRRSLTER